jgi:D-alanyl-D-alanine dipeptidase
MGEESHLSATAAMIGEQALANRQILLDAMRKFDFESYPLEYWHFAYKGKAGREVEVAFDLEIDLSHEGSGNLR